MDTTEDDAFEKAFKNNRCRSMTYTPHPDFFVAITTGHNRRYGIWHKTTNTLVALPTYRDFEATALEYCRLNDGAAWYRFVYSTQSLVKED